MSHTIQTQHRLQHLLSWSASTYFIILLLILTFIHDVHGDGTSIKEPKNERDGVLERSTRMDTVGIMNHELLFSAFAKTIFGKRDTQTLSNNIPGNGTISPGDTQQWVFPSAQLFAPPSAATPAIPPSTDQSNNREQDLVHSELKRRQNGARVLHLSLSICNQPFPSNANIDIPPPGLDLYISSPGRTDPGPTSSDPNIKSLSTTQGFVVHVHDFSEDVNFAVSAPSLSGYTGTYSYEVAASIDQLYSEFLPFPSLYLIDKDNAAAMFTTTNLTNSTTRDAEWVNKWMTLPPVFSIFVHDRNDNQIAGLKSSYCGLKNNAQIKGNIPNVNSSVEVGMTTSGGISAKQQFYVPGLNASSSYFAALGIPSNYSGGGPGVPTGGGTLWQAVNFSTNIEDTCKVIYNLSFCSTVSYAVPSNGSVSVADLSTQYDNYAQSLYQNFNFSLQQIACLTEPEAQYSLATNCSQCDNAYQSWLCAVTIPRCTTVNETYSEYRGLNQSRNPMINSEIKPGNYFEILPCGNVCFGLVQKCPASLQFACPYEQSWYYNQSYGYPGGNSSDPTCNIPGAIWGVNGGGAIRPSVITTVCITGLLILIFLG